MDKLDTADRILLASMQENARVPLDQLAYDTGLSTASVQRRLKRLREQGMIAAEVALLEPALMGFPMTFLVLVELERERLDQLDAFRRRVRSEPQVQQAYYVTGEADFALLCLARDMADFEALTSRLFFADHNVRRFRTSVVMERTKTGQMVPLSASDEEQP